MGGWMSLKSGIQQSKSIQFFHRKIASPCQNAVKDGGNVSIGEKENVFANPVHGKGRLSIHDLIVKRHKKFGTAQRTSRMAGVYFVYLSQNIPPDLNGQLFECFVICHNVFLFSLSKVRF